MHVPEGRRLFRGLNVYDNLLLGAYLRRDDAEIRRDLDYVFTLFPILHERQKQDATTLSGGEQQMCAIGRGIMSRPKLLMIDELSLGLAPRLVERLSEALLEINRTGITILLVEQDVHDGVRDRAPWPDHRDRPRQHERHDRGACRTIPRSAKPISGFDPVGTMQVARGLLTPTRNVMIAELGAEVSMPTMQARGRP